MNRRDVVLGVGVTMFSACARKPSAAQVVAAAESLPAVTVYKNEGCGCCDQWVEHLRKAGFSVQVHEMSNMGPTKERVGIPPAMGSCHTGEVAGYFVEGHVPVEDVKRLLRERPAAKGLTVPGMPIGSPGMEMDGRTQTYEVLLVARDGSTSTYARYN